MSFCHFSEGVHDEHGGRGEQIHAHQLRVVVEQPFIAQGRNNTLLNEQVNELLVHDGKRYTMVHGLHAKDWPMMDHGGSGWFTTDHADPGWITENHCGSRWNGMIGECKWILSDTDRHTGFYWIMEQK